MNHPLYNLLMYLPLKNENILQSATVVFLKKMTIELLLTSYLEQSPSISSICIPTFLLDYVCRFVLILIVGPQASIPLTPCLSNNYPTWLNHPLCYLLHLSLREDTHCWEVWEGETEKQDSWWVGLQSHNNTWHYMAAHPMGGFCQASAGQFVFPYVWRDKE